MSDFVAYALKSIFQFLAPEFKALYDKTPDEFDSFEDVLQLYGVGIKVSDESLLEKVRDNIPFQMIKELLRSDGERGFKFPLPQVIKEDDTAWRSDEEFAREMLVGINPVVIRRLQEFPPASKLDPTLYGNQYSTITEEHIINSLEGLTVTEAVEKNKLFILDHHDNLMPYLRRINTTATKVYATRTILFLKSDGTLKPLAIELSLPHPDQSHPGTKSFVCTPAEDGVEGTNNLTGYKTSYQAFAEVIKSCASISDLQSGQSLHNLVIKIGHNSCSLISKALLNLYAKCRALEDAQKLFDEITVRDTVSWNILLSGFSASGLHDQRVITMFKMIHAAREPKPSAVTLAVVIPVCTRSGSDDLRKSMHAYAMKSGMESQTLVGNAILSMYAKCGLVLDAYAVFNGIADKDVVSYNAAIAGLAENKLTEDAFQLFTEMIKVSIMPNYATISNILPICAVLGNNVGDMLGKEIHCCVLRRADLGNEVVVINALLSFYLKVGRVQEAQSLFERMKYRDMVSWNSIIAGYTSNVQWLKALEFFREFVGVKNFGLDAITVISVLPVCSQLCNLQLGKEIYGYVYRHPVLLEDTSVGNALINFYAKCRCTEAAFRAFSIIPRKDLISWNTMLDAFGINLLETQFADLLCLMIVNGVKPDAVTILTVVHFCATLSRIKNIKETHGFLLRSSILQGNSEPTLENALLDAYGKCGNMEYASKIFVNLSGKRNVVTCNSMISGYLEQGLHDDANIIFQSMIDRDITTWSLMMRSFALNKHPCEAVDLFLELQHHGIRPDAMTITSILPICGTMASADLLRLCHGYVVRACFEDAHLNSTLLDVYAKCGSMNSAYTLYQSTSQKYLILFKAMIGGFAMHGMAKEAIRVFDFMLECHIKPDHVVITTVLSACRHAGLIEEGLLIFNSTKQVHRMIPTMEQYACVVYLLGRGGQIKEALSFISEMPIAATANIWGTLLSACKTHHDLEVGQVAADHLLKIETSDIGNYVVLSNLYAADARWDGVLEMRRLMKIRDLKKPAGCSWIEVGMTKNIFVAGDYSHPERDLIYSILSDLDKQIKEQY